MSTNVGPVCEAFLKVGLLAHATGARNIKDLPGCWSYSFQRWTIAVNAHDRPINCQPVGTQMAVDVAKYSAAVWFDGWLVATFNPKGGTIMHGATVNEDAFIEAVDKEMQRVSGKAQ